MQFYRNLKVMISSDFFYYVKTLQATGTPVSKTHVEMITVSEKSNGLFDLRCKIKLNFKRPGCLLLLYSKI